MRTDTPVQDRRGWPHRDPDRVLSLARRSRIPSHRFLLLVPIALSLWLVSCATHSHLAPDLQPATGQWGEDHRTRQAITFLIFGDSGVGGEVQAEVGRSMRAVCERRDCHFALLLGDNIYGRGVRSVDDPQFQTKFEVPYAPLGRFDVWIVPGNHDWQRRTSVQAQIAYTERSQRWRMPHNHFAVPLLPDWVSIYGLDTTVMYDLAREGDRERRARLVRSRDAQVAAAQAALCDGKGWRFLFGHHPIYSGGHHGRARAPRGVIPEMEQALLADVIERCGVHVYFAGHEHHQEHIHAPGFEQIVQGAAGAELRRVDPVDAPGLSQAFAAARRGFGLVTVRPDSLTIEFFAAGPSANVPPIYSSSCTRMGRTIRCIAAS